MKRFSSMSCVVLVLGCSPGGAGGDDHVESADTSTATSGGTGDTESESGSELETESGSESETDTDPTTDSESTDSGDAMASVCGDGIVELDEGCDDGNSQPDDGCDPDCQPSAAVEIVAGNSTTCARTRSGAVRCWGWNAEGRLGYGHTQDIGDDETPASAGDVPLGAAAIDLGLAGSACAVLEDHTLRCWGRAESGQLGYGNLADVGDDETPADAGPVPVGAPVIAVELGDYRTCAITDEQELRCWGVGNDLGYGIDADYIVGDDETPAELGSIVVGDPVIGVAAGFQFVCVLLDSQDLRCWGEDEDAVGVLGYGSLEPHWIPPIDQIVPIGGPVVEIRGYDERVCALLDDGGVRCWGLNQPAPLGYLVNDFAIGDDETPAELGDLDLGGPAISIAVGKNHACAVLEDGGVRCWGSAGPWLGSLSAEDVGDDESPGALPVELGGAAVQIAAGELHSCALLNTGAVRCWGFNSVGTLGYGHTEDIGDDETPAEAGDVPLF